MTARHKHIVTAAIVGFGWWGRTVARNLAGSKALRIAAVVDPTSEARDAARAAGFAAVEDLERVVADPNIEAVILCSPHKFHCAQIELCAGAGKHVFCEKPLCTSAREMDAVADAVAAARVQLGIGHERRFEPPVIDMRSRLAAGQLGTGLLMEGNFSQDKFLALPPDNWRLSAVHAPVGPLSATGIHLVDLSIALFGTPREVWARLTTRGSQFANGDTLGIMIAFESGGIAMLSAVLATPFMGRIALYGSQGWMEIRDRAHPEQPSGWDVAVAHRGGGPVTRYHPPHPAVRANLEAFGRAVAGEATYPIGLDEIAANVRAFEAIVRSTKTGKPERV
jgi:predicted dehydrogenase